MDDTQSSWTAFKGSRRIAAGARHEVALSVKAAAERASDDSVLVFDDLTGRQVDLDLRGSPDDVRARYDSSRKAAAPRGPGRPRLGVVAREVTLLPRHWDWLARQSGGASVALRRLVDAARAASSGPDRLRQAQEAADRFMAVKAGNRPGYEEAARALYARDRAKFEAHSKRWPVDVRDHARRLAEAAFAEA